MYLGKRESLQRMQVAAKFTWDQNYMEWFQHSVPFAWLEMKHSSYIDWIIQGMNSMKRIKTTPLLRIERVIL